MVDSSTKFKSPSQVCIQLNHEKEVLLEGPTSSSQEQVRTLQKESMARFYHAFCGILGFSNNQYEGGNRVTFMSISGNLTCDLISYRSSMNQIECVTRYATMRGSCIRN